MSINSCEKCGISLIGAKCHICQATDALGTKFISGIVEGLALFLGANSSEIKNCPSCTISWDEILKTGRMGCKDDYNHFKENLEPILLKFHGAIRHKA